MGRTHSLDGNLVGTCASGATVTVGPAPSILYPGESRAGAATVLEPALQCAFLKDENERDHD